MDKAFNWLLEFLFDLFYGCFCFFSFDQLASLAGIEKSDFHPLGRPKLSSTIGHIAHLDDASVETRTVGVNRDFPAKVDVSFLVRTGITISGKSLLRAGFM